MSMTPEASDAGTLKRGNLTYLPVVPGRLEFAARVRRYILRPPAAGDRCRASFLART